MVITWAGSEIGAAKIAPPVAAKAASTENHQPYSSFRSNGGLESRLQKDVGRNDL